MTQLECQAASLDQDRGEVNMGMCALSRFSSFRPKYLGNVNSASVEFHTETSCFLLGNAADEDDDHKGTGPGTVCRLAGAINEDREQEMELLHRKSFGPVASSS